MNLQLPQPEIWERLNDAIKQELSLEGEVTARVFKDLSSAVLEIAQGTAQFMSHKKAVGWVKGQTPAFEFLQPHFYKEAYEVQQMPLGKATGEALANWVAELKRDTVFVLFAEDHPVTGEIYPFVDELDRLLNEKRIASFRISHRQHLVAEAPIRPYTVRICAYAMDLTVAVCGDRFRSPSLLASSQSWSHDEIITRLKSLKSDHSSSQFLVEDFEKQMSSVAKPWFKTGENRLWDRAVLSFDEISGEALVHALAKKLGLQTENAQALLIDTTNLCHRPSVRPYKSWWEPFPGDQALSGLILFSADILSTKDFAKLVLSSYEEVKSLQSWTA